MKEHHATPLLNSEEAMQEWLREVLEGATWDCGLYQTDVLSFDETQVKPINKGLSLHLPDGSLFRLTIAKER